MFAGSIRSRGLECHVGRPYVARSPSAATAGRRLRGLLAVLGHVGLHTYVGRLYVTRFTAGIAGRSCRHVASWPAGSTGSGGLAVLGHVGLHDTLDGKSLPAAIAGRRLQWPVLG